MSEASGTADERPEPQPVEPNTQTPTSQVGTEEGQAQEGPEKESRSVESIMTSCVDRAIMFTTGSVISGLPDNVTLLIPL
jgi:hypothetical protein